MPFSTAADHRFGLFLAGAGSRLLACISVAPCSETSGESDFSKCGAASGEFPPCRVARAPSVLA